MEGKSPHLKRGGLKMCIRDRHRDFLLGQNHINPGDDKALYSYTPFIDALSKKSANKKSSRT